MMNIYLSCGCHYTYEFVPTHPGSDLGKHLITHIEHGFHGMDYQPTIIYETPEGSASFSPLQHIEFMQYVGHHMDMRLLVGEETGYLTMTKVEW